ncbi:hypothetical protein J3R82DRAFT_8169 [Butyriboletus roseoflavus]|nr:hypothetical protein J3R82DRAFT_8169 [Butyriboletus roseoflavus]
MLSNFIRRNGKRKGNKANESRSHKKSSSASSSLASSSIFNIKEECPAPSSRLVELKLSNSNEEWFPQELLRSRSPSPGSSPLRAQNTPVTQNNLTQETHADSPPELSPSRSGNVSPSIPAPIFIPDPGLRLPNVQVQVAPSAVPPLEKSHLNPNHASLSPPSPSTSDNLSVISGTTLLAHLLIGSSFGFSPNERRSIRYRSGVTRQDSATLPRSEVSFPLDAGTSLRPNYSSTIKSVASTELEYPMSDSCISSPEIVISSVIPRQASSTQEFPSAPTSTRASPSVILDTTPRRKAGPVPTHTRVVKKNSGVFETVIEVQVPINTRETTTQHSSQEGSFLLSSDDHGLDEFDFVPPEPTAESPSASSDSNTSYIAPLPKRSDANRGQQKRMVGGSTLVRNGSKDSSLADSIPASHQGYGIPSAAISEHDYGELLNYDLTVSPESTACSHIPSSGSAGYQTFPETPTDIKFEILKAWVRKVVPSYYTDPGRLCWPYKSRLHRKQPESKLSPSVQVNDKAGIPDETNQSLTTNTGEPMKVQPAVWPHPLARNSSSSSYLREEEALQALAPHLTSSLPSILIDALLGPTTMLHSVMDSSIKSPTSVPLPDSIDGSPFNSPALVDGVTAASPSTSPLKPSIPTTTTTVNTHLPSSTPFSPPSSSFGTSFLPSPSPPASLNEPLPPPLSPIPFVFSPAALDGFVSPSPSSLPPPPYHTVVSERTAHHPGSISTPSLLQKSSSERGHQRSRQASNSSLASGSVRSRGRARPPLPIGPRKPSGRGQALGSFVPGAQGRNGSTSSVGSGDPTGSPGSLRHKLQTAVSKPPPRFQHPPPKWRGLTLEAAQWTFTSAQLQEMVSQAIQQASEGSSLRLLRLEVLEGEIGDEMHRLELQHTDIKAQYKALVRKRWTLMGVLAGHIEGVEMNDATTVSRTMEELAEVLLTLDRLADKMHSSVLQMGHLKSLRDVHHASALAMAVRKINGLFIRQTAEKERLQGEVNTLQTERDEAWKHAEDIAQDYDTLSDRVSETARTSGGVQMNADAQCVAGNKCSKRLSAVRKSTVCLSQAGLRSRTRRPTSLAPEDIPPLPRVRVKPLSIRSTTLPISTGTGISFGSAYSSNSPTSETLALVDAQREVYEMLGLSLPPSQASSRRRTLSGPDHIRPPSLSTRSMSDSLADMRAPRQPQQQPQQQQRRQRRLLSHGEHDASGGRGASSWTV